MDVDSTRLRHERRGVWMRIRDLDGIEQSSVMVIGDYTFYLHSKDDTGVMSVDYEHESGSEAENTRELVGLAARLAKPDGGKFFANGRAPQLLVSA